MEVDFSKRKVKRQKMQYSVITLDLFKPGKNKYPEFDYEDIRKNQLGEDDSSGDDERFHDKEALEMVRKLEAKYGNKTTKSGKKVCFGGEDDYIDKSAGYDLDDDFIDDTEAYDEWIPSSLDTLKGGFYVNQGKLDFKWKRDELDDSDISDAEIPTSSAPKKKHKLTTVLHDHPADGSIPVAQMQSSIDVEELSNCSADITRLVGAPPTKRFIGKKHASSHHIAKLIKKKRLTKIESNIVERQPDATRLELKVPMTEFSPAVPGAEGTEAVAAQNLTGGLSDVVKQLSEASIQEASSSHVHLNSENVAKTYNSLAEEVKVLSTKTPRPLQNQKKIDNVEKSITLPSISKSIHTVAKQPQSTCIPGTSSSSSVPIRDISLQSATEKEIRMMLPDLELRGIGASELMELAESSVDMDHFRKKMALLVKDADFCHAAKKTGTPQQSTKNQSNSVAEKTNVHGENLAKALKLTAAVNPAMDGASSSLAISTCSNDTVSKVPTPSSDIAASALAKPKVKFTLGQYIENEKDERVPDLPRISSDEALLVFNNELISIESVIKTLVDAARKTFDAKVEQCSKADKPVPTRPTFLFTESFRIAIKSLMLAFWQARLSCTSDISYTTPIAHAITAAQVLETRVLPHFDELVGLGRLCLEVCRRNPDNYMILRAPKVEEAMKSERIKPNAATIIGKQWLAKLASSVNKSVVDIRKHHLDEDHSSDRVEKFCNENLDNMDVFDTKMPTTSAPKKKRKLTTVLNDQSVDGSIPVAHIQSSHDVEELSNCSSDITILGVAPSAKRFFGKKYTSSHHAAKLIKKKRLTNIGSHLVERQPVTTILELKASTTEFSSAGTGPMSTEAVSSQSFTGALSEVVQKFSEAEIKEASIPCVPPYSENMTYEDNGLTHDVNPNILKGKILSTKAQTPDTLENRRKIDGTGKSFTPSSTSRATHTVSKELACNRDDSLLGSPLMTTGIAITRNQAECSLPGASSSLSATDISLLSRTEEEFTKMLPELARRGVSFSEVKELAKSSITVDNFRKKMLLLMSRVAEKTTVPGEKVAKALELPVAVNTATGGASSSLTVSSCCNETGDAGTKVATPSNSDMATSAPAKAKVKFTLGQYIEKEKGERVPDLPRISSDDAVLAFNKELISIQNVIKTLVDAARKTFEAKVEQCSKTDKPVPTKPTFLFTELFHTAIKSFMIALWQVRFSFSPEATPMDHAIIFALVLETRLLPHFNELVGLGRLCLEVCRRNPDNYMILRAPKVEEAMKSERIKPNAATIVGKEWLAKLAPSTHSASEPVVISNIDDEVQIVFEKYSGK